MSKTKKDDVNKITVADIQKYICPKATTKEAYVFMKLCQAHNLNPFVGDAHLIKYGNEDATIVVGKYVFLKRATNHPQYGGFQAGIIVQRGNEIIKKQGSLLLKGEKLLGGWAKVYRKDWTQPVEVEVSLEEYARKKKDGTLMKNWKEMPATMIRKVAVAQGHREAFPQELGGLYSPEEMPIDSSQLPEPQPIEIEQKETPEEEVIDTVAEDVPEPEPSPAPETQKNFLTPRGPEVSQKTNITQKQMKLMNKLFHDLEQCEGEPIDRKTRLKLVSNWVKREVNSSKELTKEEASTVIEKLNELIEEYNKEKNNE